MTAGVRCRVFEDVSKLRTNRGSSLRSSVPSAVKCLPQRAQRTAEKSSEEQEYSRMTPIYLDYNATTPIDPAVRAAMMPFLEEHRSEEHTSELQSHSFISYAVFCLKK